MVLIGRQDAFSDWRKDKALDAFITLLFEPNTPIKAPEKVSRTDHAVVATLSALRHGKREPFEQAVSLISRRSPTAESDWVYDDLLIFAIVIGNLRFGGADQLVEDLLRMRLSVGGERSLGIPLSLKALSSLKEDAPILPVLIVGRILVDSKSRFEGETLLNAVGQATELELNESAPFLRLLAQKVSDLATAIGSQDRSEEYFALVLFRANFDARARAVGVLIFIGLSVLSTVLWMFFLWLYFFGSKASEELVGKLIALGVFAGPYLVFRRRKALVSMGRSSFYRAFGGRHLIGSETVTNQD